MQNNAT